MMAAMDRETLLAELNRLLAAGEPLLTMFPKKKDPDDWWFQLPDNISDEMNWYANDVGWNAGNREQYQGYLQSNSNVDLAWLVNKYRAGLLGWRAIGVLK